MSVRAADIDSKHAENRLSTSKFYYIINFFCVICWGFGLFAQLTHPDSLVPSQPAALGFAIALGTLTRRLGLIATVQTLFGRHPLRAAPRKNGSLEPGTGPPPLQLLVDKLDGSGEQFWVHWNGVFILKKEADQFYRQQKLVRERPWPRTHRTEHTPSQHSTPRCRTQQCAEIT